ncbi:MAG TPA: hypothetical protein VKA30_01605, partial [Actinomycetota bacterium]|nr:hypothetical protein [Actinomycetota bacterium]
DDPDSCMSYHPSSPKYPDQHDIDQLACETHTKDEAEPGRNCTYASTDAGSSCILGIICLSSQSNTSAYQSQPEAHNDMVIIHLTRGATVLRFFMRPPRSAFVGPNRTLW